MTKLQRGFLSLPTALAGAPLVAARGRTSPPRRRRTTAAVDLTSDLTSGQERSLQ